MWKRFKAWLERRKYTTEMQLDNLRTMLHLDARWMAHSPVVAALTTRYRAALGADWYKLRTEQVEPLRRRLGLEPGALAADAKKVEAEARVLTAETAHSAHIALKHALAVVENEIVKSKIGEALRELEEKHPEVAGDD